MARELKLQVVLSALDKITGPLKKARAGSKELASALKATRDRLKQLEGQSGKIDSFRKLASGIRDTRTAMTEAQAKVRD
ncbi:MAG: hypothetical protein GX776_08565, partial [Oxalobacter sp.]|nr:hypothetical protein [Oxalobacter sp.]